MASRSTDRNTGRYARAALASQVLQAAIAGCSRMDLYRPGPRAEEVTA